MKELPTVSPVRSCGACTACCMTTAVDTPEVRKPSQTRCQHQTKQGCSIYEARPSSCAAYTCMWVLGWGRVSDRPDRLGLVVESANRAVPWIVLVSEVWPRAREGKRAQQLLAALASQAKTVAILRRDHVPLIVGEVPTEADMRQLVESMEVGR